MNKETVEYNYQSAMALLRNARIFGKKINADDPKEIIAVLYMMYLSEDVLNNELKRERDFIINS